MIHIFFDLGTFGSTIEFVLHNYSSHGTPVDAGILADGSMHSFEKEWHLNCTDQVKAFLDHTNVNPCAITTPSYPFKEYHLPDIIKQFSAIATWHTDKKILIYQPTLRSCELNLLFKYHKVCAGTKVHVGLGVIIGDNQHNIVRWNKSYTHWSQMKVWELREWLSIFYPGYVKEFINAQYHATDDWLTITNLDLLDDTKATLLTVIDHCGLENTAPLDDFVVTWRQAQQYIVDEFDLLDQIVENTINNNLMEWLPINIVAESIVQQRLRARGYNIRCDGLDIFPTDSTTLFNLLEKHNA